MSKTEKGVLNEVVNTLHEENFDALQIISIGLEIVRLGMEKMNSKSIRTIDYMDNLLELLKSGPLSMEELMAKSPFPENQIRAAIDFLQKQGLIKVKDDQVEITKSGLSFLELPVD